MFLLKSKFSKDVIIVILVTIIIGSVVASASGYIADFYFGDALTGLIGDYGEYDLLLIVDGEKKEKAYQQIKEVINHRLSGSKIESGVKIAGKTNFFIKLAQQYQNRQTYLEIDDYFKNIMGLNSLSVMTEPKITIRGLNPKSSKFLETKINKLTGVNFTFPDGDKLEVVLNRADMLPEMKEKINNILEKYQVISVRFPITHQEKKLLKLGDQLTRELNRKEQAQIRNVTATGATDIEALVKTMTEMKSFLSSYATKLTIKLKAGVNIQPGSKLVLPAKDKKQVIIRVTEISDNKAEALIEQGDSSNILGKQAYQLNNDQLGNLVGEIKVKNPRQQLAYTVTQLVELVPRLEVIFQNTDKLIVQLQEIAVLFQELEGSLTEVGRLNHKLKGYQDDLSKVNLVELKETVDQLESTLDKLAQVARALEFLQGLITEVNRSLGEMNQNLTLASERLNATDAYRSQLEELQQTISELSTRIEDNSSEIITYINQYNPILQEVVSWQGQVKEFSNILDQVDKGEKDQLQKLSLDKIIKPEMVNKIGEVDSQNLGDDLTKLNQTLNNLQRVDFPAIIKELEYIQQSLPKLKDEEITASMDLIDKYIAGKVIPGEEITLLVPQREVNISRIKTGVKNFFTTEVSLYTSQLGIISPNLRGQVYQVLSEVKMVLTALIAIICTIFSLLFDQTLIINLLRLIQQEDNKKWYTDLSLYYGLLSGALILGIIFYLTPAGVPYLPDYISLLIGAGLGLIAVNKAKVMNEISKAEFRAGEALGFNYTEIMREIVIPDAKPGLLQLLNQSKTYF